MLGIKSRFFCSKFSYSLSHLSSPKSFKVLKVRGDLWDPSRLKDSREEQMAKLAWVCDDRGLTKKILLYHRRERERERLSVYVCLSVSVSGLLWGLHVHMHVWGRIWYWMLLSTYFVVGVGSLTEPVAFWLTKLAGQQAPEIHLSLLLRYLLSLAFYMRSKDLNVGPHLGGKANPLSAGWIPCYGPFMLTCSGA